MRVNAATARPTPVAAGMRRIFSQPRSLSVSQVIRRVFRVGVQLPAVRLLGVEAFVSYVLALTVVEMVAIVSGYGYMDLLTREIAQHPDWAEFAA